MRTLLLKDDRGMALAVALFALVIIGTLVAGTFFSGRQEQQSGQNTFFAGQAAEAAEAGLSDAIGTMTPTSLLGLVAGGAAADLGTVSLGGGVDASRQLSRLTSSVFLIRSEGHRRNGGGTALATRSAGSLIRLVTPKLVMRGGLTAIGKVTVTGNATVSGNDTTPPNWLSAGVECPPEADKGGVVYNGTLTQSGSSEITGAPPKQLDATLTPANLLGQTSFEQLKALRTLTLTSNISGIAPALTSSVPAACKTTVQTNWGAPLDKTSPCFDYFPIIYHYGDLSISGSGAGQGILLVEGKLNIQGQVSFFGPVIATGAVNVQGTGTDEVKFYGGLIASDVQLDDSKLSGNATVLYSSCANRRALLGSGVITRLSERGWVQLY
ncbi:MAG TPA: hypothetical protein VGP44_08935 [Gemmatimonadales bacterium]|nr:hypothetical protein [Gemmatimonadales bacterium]